MSTSVDALRPWGSLMRDDHHLRLPGGGSGPDFASGRIPAIPLILGLGGVLPFAAGAYGATGAMDGIGLSADASRMALMLYAALILSFLGGVRWGVGLKLIPAAAATRHMFLSVVPALVAWCALLAARPADIAILIAAFAVVGVADLQMAIDGETPRWHGRLRIILTTAVLLCLVWSAAFGK